MLTYFMIYWVIGMIITTVIATYDTDLTISEIPIIVLGGLIWIIALPFYCIDEMSKNKTVIIKKWGKHDN